MATNYSDLVWDISFSSEYALIIGDWVIGNIYSIVNSRSSSLAIVAEHVFFIPFSEFAETRNEL